MSHVLGNLSRQNPLIVRCNIRCNIGGFCHVALGFGDFVTTKSPNSKVGILLVNQSLLKFFSHNTVQCFSQDSLSETFVVV